jgi:hypothetical protein
MEGQTETRAREFLGEDLPVGIRNYRTQNGWTQAVITIVEDALIQSEVRKRNNEVMQEAIADAKQLLSESGLRNAVTPQRVADLALFLAERRILHISRIYDEYLTLKVSRERQEQSYEDRMEAEG